MQTLYFYDLETSGINPREARVMQFAGQRTTLDLEPIGEPQNFLIKMTEDTLPDPDALLVTMITPQQTLQDGLSEAEFLQIFIKEVALPETIFVGFNSVRFDDEFMRFMHYRNFYDPYEWQWKDERSRWDLLDVVRMTRALRPDGIKWPKASDGSSTNTLTKLTSINKLDHANAHDALNDVLACIALAKLLRQKQPKLFDYLLGIRDKKHVAALVNSPTPFVYSSGKYSSEFEKTTIVVRLAERNKNRGILVYDLRHDPTPYLSLSPAELVEAWKYKPREDTTSLRLPVKSLQFNRCPAVAPLSVLDKSALERLKMDMSKIKDNIKLLQAGASKFVENLSLALDIMDKRQQEEFFVDQQDVDSKLYDSFLGDADRKSLPKVRSGEIDASQIRFDDERLQELIPLYRARNFPKNLSADERVNWEKFRVNKLLGGGEKSRAQYYFKRISELSQASNINKNKEYVLKDLQLWGESILPLDEL